MGCSRLDGSSWLQLGLLVAGVRQQACFGLSAPSRLRTPPWLRTDVWPQVGRSPWKLDEGERVCPDQKGNDEGELRVMRPSPTCGPTCASAGPTCAPAGPTCTPREARAPFLHTSPTSPVNPSSHLGMVELLPPRIVPSTVSQLPRRHGALALGGAVSANINPSSHVSMVEFGAAAAMIGLSIPALTWGRCSRLCRTPYYGRPEYGSFLNFVWLNKPCEASPRIRMPLRWRAES